MLRIEFSLLFERVDPTGTTPRKSPSADASPGARILNSGGDHVCFERPDADAMPREDWGIQTGRLHEMALEDILTSAQRPTRPRDH